MAEIGHKSIYYTIFALEDGVNIRKCKFTERWKQPAHQFPLWMTSQIAGVLVKCLPC